MTKDGGLSAGKRVREGGIPGRENRKSPSPLYQRGLEEELGNIGQKLVYKLGGRDNARLMEFFKREMPGVAGDQKVGLGFQGAF